MHALHMVCFSDGLAAVWTVAAKGFSNRLGLWLLPTGQVHTPCSVRLWFESVSIHLKRSPNLTGQMPYPCAPQLGLKRGYAALSCML
jgi:hypothetical protein